MFKSVVSVLLAAVCVASRVSLQGAIKDSSFWTKGVRAPEGHTLTLHVMLRHNLEDVARLEKVLMQVSDPRSDLYGQHLSLADVGDLTAIPAARLQTVREFFASSATTFDLTPNKDIATVVLTVAQAETLFQTTIHTFTHADGAVLLRASDYSLPEALAAAVYVVGDLTELPRIPTPTKPMPIESQVGGAGKWPNACPTLSKCNGLVTPAVLVQRYNIDGSGMNATGNSMAVAEFQGQYFTQKDIDKFGSSCNVNVTVDKIIGGDKQQAGVEALLDIEYIRGVSPGIPLTVIYSAEFSLLDWTTTLNGRDDAELVHSVSYGNDEKQQTTTDYMLSCNVQFMKAGARGISILFASGDQGVCGREGCGFLSKRFKPDFPAASPYITAVGGTDFVTDDIGDETTWSAGGGGFSDTFGIPDWQTDVVAGYKADPDALLPSQSLWNNTGRGYPDVSALGGQKTPYCVVANGVAEGVAGTSASCPVVAGVFARLNGLRLAAGKAPLGFLNPWIYQNGDAFNDVTSGCNSGGVGKTDCFTAIKGWDPATGFGTPNYKVMATRL